MTYLKKAIHCAVPALALTAAILAAPNQAQADADPFVGEITQTGISGFCPRDWAATDRTLLAISSYQTLFSLLGATFGGDGRTTFALPDLRGRHPVGQGNGAGLVPRPWGQKVGRETTALDTTQLATHSHLVNVTNADGDLAGPGGKILAASRNVDGAPAETIYSTEPANRQMSADMIASSGNGESISILGPATVTRYCISLFGSYPSRS